MVSNPGSIDALESDAWAEIERQLLKFENAWHGQNPPDISAFANVPELEQDATGEHGAHRRCLIEELIKIDLEYRWKKGNPKRVEEYLITFPELDQASIRDELFRAELEARAIAAQLPEPDELAERFGTDSGNWIQVVSDMAQQSAGRSTGRSASRSSMDTIVGGGQSSGSTVDNHRVADDGSWKPGDRIDRYLLREMIGSGAFSVVWRASDTHLKRDVAIKILRPDKMEYDDSIVVRLMREARAAAAVDHPGVVKIHEVSHTANCTFIVEQFIDGPTLKKLIGQERQSTIRAVEIVRDISLALHEAHQCGVIHRDIKPANILMAGGQSPMIVDFGLAFLEQITDATLTRQGEVIGTPAYMSPQQALGQHQLVDARADVYSLGAVLFHLLADRLPFEGSTLTMLDAVVHKAPGRAALTQNSVDRDLETIVLKCLEKEPADRYQSARELADELQRHLDGQPIKARPVGAVEKAWKWSKRNPRRAGMLVGIVLLAAFLTGALFQLRSVIAQRTRAETAEKQSQALLLESSKTAGRLAIQRGKMQDAVKHLSRVGELDDKPDLEVELDLAQSLIAIREIDRATTLIKRMDVANLPPTLQGSGLILQAQLAMESGDQESAQSLFEKASQQPITAAQQLYVEAMLSESSLEVVRLLKESLELAPLSHHPRRMLLTMLISLAEFQEAKNQIKIAKQLFPDDIDFQLLESIILTALGEKPAALSVIDGLGFSPQESGKWNRLCNIVEEVRTRYSQRESEYGFNETTLMMMAKQYLEVVEPCLSTRGFSFPPKISVQFANTFDQLESFYKGETDNANIWPELKLLTDMHPEGSLVVLTVGTMLGERDFEGALEKCKTTRNCRGFVKDSREMHAEMRLTLAVVQLKYSPDNGRESLYETGIEAIREFEEYPYLIKRFSDEYGHILIGFLVEAFKESLVEDELIEKWMTRWKAVQGSNPNIYLWIEAVVANRQGRYGKAIDLLEEMVANAEAEGPDQLEVILAQIAPMKESILNQSQDATQKAHAITEKETESEKDTAGDDDQ